MYKPCLDLRNGRSEMARDANTNEYPRSTELDSICTAQVASVTASYRFESFQGWTSNSTIERLHRRSVNPLPVADTNKFFDDRPEPGKSMEIPRAKSMNVRFLRSLRSPRCRYGYAASEEFERSLQRGSSSVRIDRGCGIGAAFNQQTLLLEGCSPHCHRRHPAWIHNRLVRIIAKFFELFSRITFLALRLHEWFLVLFLSGDESIIYYWRKEIRDIFFLMQFWKRCRRKKKGKRMNLGKWNVLHVDANTCKLENLLLPLNKFKYEWSSIWQNYN